MESSVQWSGRRRLAARRFRAAWIPFQKWACAARGQVWFTQTGCAACHPAGRFTDHQWHDVGTASRFDDSPRFPTLSLVEAWRNAPYLHDGSAATVFDVLTKPSPSRTRHGDVSKLNRAQLDDLCAYVLSL